MISDIYSCYVSRKTKSLIAVLNSHNTSCRIVWQKVKYVSVGAFQVSCLNSYPRAHVTYHSCWSIAQLHFKH